MALNLGESKGARHTEPRCFANSRDANRFWLPQVVAEIGSPNVVFGDTTGFYDGADGLHPFGYSHMAFIAPKVAALAFPLLATKQRVQKAVE